MKNYFLKFPLMLFILIIIMTDSCKQNSGVNSDVNPPVAKIIAKELKIHGHTRVDNYYWINNPKDSAVIDYLKAENAYTDAMLKHTDEFQKNLYNEMVARIKKTDESVPFFKNGYYYYSRTEGDKEYPLTCRKKGDVNGKEEILFNQPEMAKGEKFFSLASYAVSQDNKLVAYSVDLVSRRLYTISVKNLETGEIYKEQIKNTSGEIVWANDNKTLFYVEKDTETLLPYKVFRHELGTDPLKDAVVYEEKDNTFYTSIARSRSDKFVLIALTSTITSEFRFVDADKPSDNLQIVQPRIRGLEYSADHFDHNFYINTNLDAKNFKLVKTSDKKTTKENWVDVIPHRSDVFLQSFEIFKNYLVVNERKEGLPQLFIQKWSEKTGKYIKFEEEAYSARINNNPDANTDILRFNYTSMTTPSSIYDFNMQTGERKLMKRTEVVGDFKPENYETKRLWAVAKDGVKVPMTIVYKKGFQKDASHPLFIYGYGSYGYSMDPGFNSSILSLLDRGFVYAVAHIRGGQEMGRQWYENGKLLNKMNTFTDFIACTEYLVNEKYADPAKVAANGGSAGGLLMGAVANLKPDLYKAIVANVPFVDVVTTMLDESIPLTTGEFDEWGNPKTKEYYDYMLAYSPYDNVKAQKYPAMLVTTGLHDSQVQYYEPTKWVAKLRTLKTDKNPLCLKINMEFGHGGASGRFEQLKERALIYAFVMDQMGISK